MHKLPLILALISNESSRYIIYVYVHTYIYIYIIYIIYAILIIIHMYAEIYHFFNFSRTIFIN